MIQDVNQREANLRNHPNFDEVYDDDKAALEAFRKAGDLGAFFVEDHDDDDDSSEKSNDESHFESIVADSTSVHRRMSLGSSVSSLRSKVSTQTSLSPLYEEDPTREADDDDEEEGGHMSPSPPKRPKATSASVTSLSVSTLGQTIIAEGSGESSSSDDE